MKDTRVVSIAAGAAALFAAAPAGAVTKQECAAAYEQTQSLQKEGKLGEAREQALLCAQEACPKIIRNDCAGWLGEIESSMPTVVFEARDEHGQETADVRVLVDGQELKERLDGKAVGIDPGEHLFRFEREGQSPLEQKHVIREGEKFRKIAISFEVERPLPAVLPQNADEKKTSPRTGAPVVAFVLGGLGLAGIGVGATFGILGLNERSDLAASCAPTCTDDAIGGVRTKLLVADISAAAGVALVGVATVLFITAPSSKSTSPSATQRLRFGAAPIAGGGFANIHLSF